VNRAVVVERQRLHEQHAADAQARIESMRTRMVPAVTSAHSLCADIGVPAWRT
jgi:hypothetical protein